MRMTTNQQTLIIQIHHQLIKLLITVIIALMETASITMLLLITQFMEIILQIMATIMVFIMVLITILMEHTIIHIMLTLLITHVQMLIPTKNLWLYQTILILTPIDWILIKQPKIKQLQTIKLLLQKKITLKMKWSPIKIMLQMHKQVKH